jgi:hypothetical protein
MIHLHHRISKPQTRRAKFFHRQNHRVLQPGARSRHRLGQPGADDHLPVTLETGIVSERDRSLPRLCDQTQLFEYRAPSSRSNNASPELSDQLPAVFRRIINDKAKRGAEPGGTGDDPHAEHDSYTMAQEEGYTVGSPFSALSGFHVSS